MPDRTMKALSLWQPWASLVALHAKRVETRHWPAPEWLVGRRFAIHAAKTTQHLEVCATWPFGEHITAPRSLPLGAIVATAVLDRCTPITAESAAELEQTNPREFAFGLYHEGRYAWVLRDVEALTEPITVRGAQGLWNVPEEILPALDPVVFSA